MRLLLPLLLLFASTSAFNSFEFDYDIPTDYFGPKRHLIESVGRTPSERGDPDPNTAGQMNLRFKEDVFGVLNSRSRAHFDDLAQYFHPKIQIHVCFVPGRALKKNELWAVMAYLSLFYQKLHEEQWVPYMNQGFSFWKIYWVTKKCTRDVTQHIALLDGATILGEVNKRFCGMINGENWDVYQSFLDLFEKSDTQWGTCAGSKRQTYDHIRGHMEKVATRYAKCTVYVRIRNLVAADFSTTFLVSRATEVQEQEELDVGFAGFKDKKGLWQMNRMYFECDETKKKKKRMILDL
ncbi:Protein CBG12965 [Caenorhabditis briggsae]|uniref:Protein CBG12965 n=1 Tax=Caenorhabditis briggsae TaxID=6238 RepID=A8XGS4_CAEBR|nr:Protein CBG12965 [Caenorhabditis briggsae]CAP31848.1 Protein CBG12965 [Caenorhabditis briggsae]